MFICTYDFKHNCLEKQTRLLFKYIFVPIIVLLFVKLGKKGEPSNEVKCFWILARMGSYSFPGRPVPFYDVLEPSRTSYVVLGRPRAFQDVLYRSRTS